MLAIARQKVSDEKVHFKQTDITTIWNLEKSNLITCSLVLEHIKNIDFIFQQAATTLVENGQFFICELHPYKQIMGSRAKFEDGGKMKQLEYFIHPISEFFQSGKLNGFICEDLQEWVDTEDKTGIPRLVSFLFRLKE